jgi:hypothetical protein
MRQNMSRIPFVYLVATGIFIPIVLYFLAGPYRRLRIWETGETKKPSLGGRWRPAGATDEGDQGL